MEFWVIKVELEAKELSVKIKRLTTFLVSEKAKEIDEEQFKLLKKQLSVMKKYLSILKERLKLSGKEAKEDEC